MKIKINRTKDLKNWSFSKNKYFSKSDLRKIELITEQLNYFYASWYFELDFKKEIIESNKEFFIISCKDVDEFSRLFLENTGWKNASRIPIKLDDESLKAFKLIKSSPTKLRDDS